MVAQRPLIDHAQKLRTQGGQSSYEKPAYAISININLWTGRTIGETF